MRKEDKNASMERIGKQVTAAGNGISSAGALWTWCGWTHTLPLGGAEILRLCLLSPIPHWLIVVPKGANSPPSAHPVHWREEASAMKHQYLE